ncbi:acylphosphatase [Sphingomonas sp. PvP055]
MMAMQRVFVSGRVQNVGFRDWTVRRASELDLTGWVRNRTDGRVEILVVGDEATAAQLVALCHDGPPTARVDHVAVEVADERPPKGFTKRFTA